MKSFTFDFSSQRFFTTFRKYFQFSVYCLFKSQICSFLWSHFDYTTDISSSFSRSHSIKKKCFISFKNTLQDHFSQQIFNLANFMDTLRWISYWLCWEFTHKIHMPTPKKYFIQTFNFHEWRCYFIFNCNFFFTDDGKFILFTNQKKNKHSELNLILRQKKMEYIFFMNLNELCNESVWIVCRASSKNTVFRWDRIFSLISVSHPHMENSIEIMHKITNFQRTTTTTTEKTDFFFLL